MSWLCAQATQDIKTVSDADLSAFQPIARLIEHTYGEIHEHRHNYIFKCMKKKDVENFYECYKIKEMTLENIYRKYYDKTFLVSRYLEECDKKYDTDTCVKGGLAMLEEFAA